MYQDERLFKKSPDELFDESSIVAIAPIYLLESSTACWKCGLINSVFCLAASGVKEEGFQDQFVCFSNLQKVPDILSEFFKVKTPRYYLDYTYQSESIYYINHCACGAKQGDFYLHDEPESPFFPLTSDDAKCLMLYPIKSLNDIEIKSGYCSQEDDLITIHAQRKNLQWQF